MNYIDKKIPTFEEKFIEKSRMIDLPKLRPSNQKSITCSVTDGIRRWLIATSNEKTEIIKTQTTQDLNTERIAEYLWINATSATWLRYELLWVLIP